MPYSILEPLKKHIPMGAKAQMKDWLLSAAVWRSGTPDVLLIGAMKGGTTSLFNYLVQHPRIFPGIGKEIWYLSGSKLAKGETWYRRHFLSPWQRKLLEARVGGRIQTVDASADSICSPDAPARAWKINRDARIVAVLRDPVKRAISQYRFQLEIGHSFAAPSLDEEVTRQLDDLEKNGIDLRARMASSTQERLVTQGLYSEMLKPWINTYGEVCVVESESLFESAEAETNRVLHFLGLPPSSQIQFGVFNVTGNAVSGKATLSKEVAERLRDFYRQHNGDLEDLLGQKFRWISGSTK